MQFGAFIGPWADDIAGVRERVLAAERSGFDFVSIQDHPYVPAYLDTFSLIANLMATTSTLRFITNVANLPLRPAPMLAKAAASIDRLSNGRFDLGLGAGRVWSEIERMGGPTWTPGESIGAMSEAIDTLRTAWGFEAENRARAAPGVARLTGSASGLAVPGRGCSASSDARPTGGSLPWLPATRPSPPRRTALTPLPPPPGATRRPSAE